MDLCVGHRDTETPRTTAFFILTATATALVARETGAVPINQLQFSVPLCLGGQRKIYLKQASGGEAGDLDESRLELEVNERSRMYRRE